jgi:hypothetical protein
MIGDCDIHPAVLLPNLDGHRHEAVARRGVDNRLDRYVYRANNAGDSASTAVDQPDY